MNTSGSCSLLIRGSQINFDEVDMNLKVKPTRVVKKGDVISKSIGPSQYDVWVYEIRHDENGNPKESLTELLSNLKSSRDFLHTIFQTADVSVKCYIQSDLAQISFEFSPEIIKELAELGVKLEISILSWGGVEDR